MEKGGKKSKLATNGTTTLKPGENEPARRPPVNCTKRGTSGGGATTEEKRRILTVERNGGRWSLLGGKEEQTTEGVGVTKTKQGM